MLKRPVALLLLVTMAPHLTGCVVHSAYVIRPSELRPDERGAPALRIAGATVTGEGAYLFDTVPTPRLTRDTLYAWREGVPHVIPRGAIRVLVVQAPGGSFGSVATSSLDSAAAVVLGRRILGATTRDGARVVFDPASAVSVQGDTMYGVVAGAPRRIALADVERVEVRRTNVAMTVVATGAVVLTVVPVVALLLAGAMMGPIGGGARWPQ